MDLYMSRGPSIADADVVRVPDYTRTSNEAYRVIWGLGCGADDVCSVTYGTCAGLPVGLIRLHVTPTEAGNIADAEDHFLGPEPVVRDLIERHRAARREAGEVPADEQTINSPYEDTAVALSIPWVALHPELDILEIEEDWERLRAETVDAEEVTDG